MAVKRLGTNGHAADVDRAHWGGNHLGYGGPATVMARETARPVIIEPERAKEPPKPTVDKRKNIKTKADKEDTIAVNIRIPASVLAHYKRGGRGYQTRMVEDLRKAIDAEAAALA